MVCAPLVGRQADSAERVKWAADYKQNPDAERSGHDVRVGRAYYELTNPGLHGQ